MTRLFAGTPFDIPPRCDDCGELETDCICTPEQKKAAADKQAADKLEAEKLAKRLPPESQTAKVLVEKRKGNRKATVISGLTSEANDLPDLLQKLQSACGVGGTVKAKENLVELQGDHRDKVAAQLKALGYRVR